MKEMTFMWYPHYWFAFVAAGKAAREEASVLLQSGAINEFELITQIKPCDVAIQHASKDVRRHMYKTITNTGNIQEGLIENARKKSRKDRRFDNRPSTPATSESSVATSASSDHYNLKALEKMAFTLKEKVNLMESLQCPAAQVAEEKRKLLNILNEIEGLLKKQVSPYIATPIVLAPISESSQIHYDDEDMQMM
jgi:hypothetical protein